MSDRVVAALERIAAAVERIAADGAGGRDGLALLADGMAAWVAQGAGGAPDGVVRLPLPEPGFAIVYGPEEEPGRFFLLLETPEGVRLPLPW